MREIACRVPQDLVALCVSRKGVCAVSRPSTVYGPLKRRSSPLSGTHGMPPASVPERADIGTSASTRPGDTLGYARVSTGEQNPDAQRDRLFEAGAIRVFTDVASGNAPSAPGSPSSSTTPGPETACVSPVLTDSGTPCANFSRLSTTSRPEASTWSASRSASIPLRPPASSCSTSSAPSPISRHGSSPIAPATASPRRVNAADNRADRRSIRRRFRWLRNSLKAVCRRREQQNSSELAEQRLTGLPPRCAERFPRP